MELECKVVTPRGDLSLYCFLRRERSTYFHYTLGISTSFCHQILDLSFTSKILYWFLRGMPSRIWALNFNFKSSPAVCATVESMKIFYCVNQYWFLRGVWTRSAACCRRRRASATRHTMWMGWCDDNDGRQWQQIFWTTWTNTIDDDGELSECYLFFQQLIYTFTSLVGGQ